VKLEQLDYNLDEFTFRFNRRNSKSRRMLCYRLVHKAINVAPGYTKEIEGGGNSLRIFCRGGMNHEETG
jgi:hypothetical protein